MKNIIRPALSLFVLLSVITGVLYPLAVTGAGKVLFPEQAQGSLIVKDGVVVGSALIGQNFSEAKYFWPRPSATGPMPYNAASSSGSNQGPLNPALVDAVKGRIAALRAVDPDNQLAVPVDLVQVNGRFFGTVGVLGIGADSAIAVSRWMSAAGARGAVARRLGGWTYRLSGLRQLLRRRAATIALGIAVDAGTPGQPSEVHAAFVANTALMGGGLRLPADVTPDDGRFELCLVPRLPRGRLLWAFLCLSQGWAIPDGVLLTSRGSSAHITADDSIVFAADGEVVCTDRSFTLTSHRHALRVIC